MNINSIHGGMAEIPAGANALPAPCVPDSCRIVIDRRFLVEEPLQQVRDEMTELLDGLRDSRPNFDYNMREMMHVLPSMTARDAPVVTSVAQSIRDVMGVDAEYIASPGTYDQKHIDRIGKLKNCIAYGPGILEMAHKPDEYIGVDDMIDSAEVMALSLLDILTNDGVIKIVDQAHIFQHCRAKQTRGPVGGFQQRQIIPGPQFQIFHRVKSRCLQGADSLLLQRGKGFSRHQPRNNAAHGPMQFCRHLARRR
jgi:hypothetical protein